MNYGLYLSAGGALSSIHRQSVLANNLANMRTIGFKPDVVDVRARLPERLEGGTMTEPRELLERLGGGVHLTPTRVALGQGNLIATGRDLDLALEGEGFFTVADRAGAPPEDRRLTRDGRFTMNDRGELVTVAGGNLILDTAGNAVRLDPTRPVHIDDAGVVNQDGSAVATLGLVRIDDPRDLVKVGGNLLRAADGATPGAVTTSPVRQGFTEASAVDPILTMNAMISAAKAAQGNLKMMQYHDQLLGQTFNTFGRVA